MVSPRTTFTTIPLSSNVLHRNRVAQREGYYGSWLCENAAAGSLTGLDCGATKLGKVLEHILPISSATETDAAPRIVSARDSARKAKVRAHHALTAAIIGLTPNIFSTRVTCNDISVATLGSVFVRKCAATIRILIVQKGCSTVSRRVLMASVGQVRHASVQ